MDDMLLIKPRQHDLGEFVVRRLLPYAARRMVGPFIFFDHMGPAEFPPGSAVNVRPHPHIGLATLTYLFEGEILHRDSLGSCQTITAGDVNWMVAGAGITHSERVSDAVRASGQRMQGLQLWIALPRQFEDMLPEFHHHDADQLPRFTLPGAELTLIAGNAYGHASPVKIFSPMCYLDVRLEAGASLDLPEGVPELAIYLLDGVLTANGETVARYDMASWIAPDRIELRTDGGAHLVIIGGERLAEPRFIFWNFVASDPQRLERAKQDWRDGRFAMIPGDDLEFIPLPE